jgi:glycosyltransferase involved in cell wall biosynthesis
VSPVTIHNVFALPAEAPAFDVTQAPLRLYWVGQTIGPGRGLEEAIDALGRAGIGAVLHVRGRVASDFAALLRARAAVAGVMLSLLPPVPPDQVVASARGYDVGLAAETDLVENRHLCISNKVLTFPLAGLAVVAADTAGTAPVLRDLGAGALACGAGDVDGLARGLSAWDRDRALLATAKRASWDAAVRRWHWQHPEERGRLLSLVDDVLGRPCGS